MKLQRNLLCLAMSSFALLTAYANAEDEFSFDDDEEQSTQVYQNSIELGVGHTRDGNGKLGEFANTLDDDGSFVIGNIHLSGGAEDGSHLLYLTGTKNEFGGNFELGYNRPGTFSMEIYGYESQKVEMENVLTLYPSGSGNVLALPDGFIDSEDLNSYGRRDLLVERNTYGITITRHFGPHWQANLDYSRQDKDGEKSATGSQGFRGTAIIIEPVNYQHDQFTLGVEFTGTKLALGASYYLSDLNNSDKELTFENPNLLSIGSEQLALPPNNEFTRFDINGSYRMGDRTMLNWLLNWSEAKQNESFLPYALDTDFYNGDFFSPFASSSLKGKVQRFNGRITLVSRPARNINYKVEYAVRNRKADHDPSLWDSLSYSGNVGTLGAPSHVYDKERETFKLEGGYRFANRSKVRFGWKRENIDRTRDEIEHIEDTAERINDTDKTEEDTFWVAYRFSLLDKLNLSLRIERASRNASPSDIRIEHLHFVSTDSEDNLETEGENTLPFYLSDRDTKSYALNVDIPLNNTLILSGGFNLTDEDYDDDFDGLLGREMQTFDIGLSFRADEDLSITLYGLLQKFEWDQDGTTSGGSGSVSSLWLTKGEDESKVFGVTVDWQAIPKKLHLTADLSTSNSDSEVSSFDRLNNLSDNLPGYGTDVTRLDVKANWQWNPKIAIQTRYIYEDWNANDYAWSGDLLDGIAYGWKAPNESGHAIILGIGVNF